jgi:hypothetical protein
MIIDKLPDPSKSSEPISGSVAINLGGIDFGIEKGSFDYKQHFEQKRSVLLASANLEIEENKRIRKILEDMLYVEEEDLGYKSDSNAKVLKQIMELDSNKHPSSKSSESSEHLSHKTDKKPLSEQSKHLSHKSDEQHEQSKHLSHKSNEQPEHSSHKSDKKPEQSEHSPHKSDKKPLSDQSKQSLLE